MTRLTSINQTFAGKFTGTEKSSSKDKIQKFLSFFQSPAMSKCHCCDPIFEAFNKLGNICKKNGRDFFQRQGK
jgi:hypothetical protein